VRESVSDIEEFAPAFRIDIPLDDFAGARLLEERAEGATESVLGMILVKRICARPFLLRAGAARYRNRERGATEGAFDEAAA